MENFSILKVSRSLKELTKLFCFDCDKEDKMEKLKFLFAITLASACVIIVHAQCGEPQMPEDATYNEPSDYPYPEGAKIQTTCGFWASVSHHERVCKNGRWMPEQAQCGLPVEEYYVDKVRVHADKRVEVDVRFSTPARAGAGPDASALDL